jgi:hypothetical protein
MMESRILRLILAGLVAVGLIALTAALTRVPVPLHDDENAAVRLSWRMDRALVRECRRPTEDELARMPAHMAREEICEERMIPYHLSFAVDGRTEWEGEVPPRGMRRDRAPSVFSELPLGAGPHRIQVRFAPLGREEVGQDLPVLPLDTTLVLGPREVALVTYDRDRGQLRLRTPDRIESEPR